MGSPVGLGDFIEECFFICFPLQSQSSLQLRVCARAYVSFKPSESCSFSYWFIKSEFLGISLSCQMSYDSAERRKKNTTFIGKILSCLVQLIYLKMTDKFSSWMLALLYISNHLAWYSTFDFFKDSCVLNLFCTLELTTRA